MGLLLKQLTFLIKNRVLVKIGREELSSDFLAGFIIGQSNKLLCVESVNDDGKYDGFIFINKSDITYLKWDDNETNSLLSIYENNNQIEQKYNIEDFASLLMDFKNMNKCFAIYTEILSDDTFTLGKIIEFDQEFLLIKELGNKKNLHEPEILIKIENITMIELESNYNNSIEDIYRKRQKNVI